MIGGRLIKGDSQKLLKGDSVVDLGFQFRVGVNTGTISGGGNISEGAEEARPHFLRDFFRRGNFLSG
jgi:hypothetical protein